MNDIQIDVQFWPNKESSTKGMLIVMQGEDMLHSDVIDAAKDKARTAFLNKLKKLCPGIDIDLVRKSILGEVHRASQRQPDSDMQKAHELDVSRIVRPHLFHVLEASGLTVPIAELTANNQIDGKWLLFVQWAGGKRERLDVPDYLELGNDDRLWFHPRPPAPSPQSASPWSHQGRAMWLNGYTPKVEEIFRRLCEQFAYFLEFPKQEAVGVTATLALWTMLTYAYPVWPAVPYLSIGGPLGSGKSRVFDVLALLAYNPLHSSNLTAPCLFRTLHCQGGTLLLDEAERLNDRTPDAGEIRSVLLCGYKRGGRAHRMEKCGDEFRSVSFDVYGPKAIAGIANLPSALASRCVRIMMFRASKDSPIPKRRIDSQLKVLANLRDDLHAMALTQGKILAEMPCWQPECSSINGRDFEVWQPIMAMARLVEDAGAEHLVEIVKEHAMKSAESINEDIVPESDEILLGLLKEQLEDKPWGITAGELLEKAKDENPAIFSRYGARGIGAILNRYGIKSHRSGGKRYFRPTDNQWQAIEASYGIDLGSTEPRDETEDAD